ncbi:MAG: putative ABC transport system ATP-binding protein [Oceanospirillaceae bacterium]|jgi:putative ABC transport system ATP-binding protein
MEPTLKSFILKYSGREQLKVLLLTLIIFPVLYLSLELPKIIINEAIAGEGDRSIWGMQFTPISFLLLLCAVLLLTVLFNGAFKMRINTFKGIIGERMIRRLRYQLIGHVLRFPPAQFQRISQGEIISTVTSETEPLAGFIGDSLAQPLFQGGTMLTILTFMFMQDPILGLVSISMIPLQAYIIPKMQKRLNKLRKQRVTVVRHFSGQIGEAVDGQREIKLNGTQRYHLAQFSHTLGRLFKIRFDIFKQKFFMKFINNFLNQLPPILFYAIGGILVINGQLSIGALVAALAAYKDLVSPWKELLAYYQQYQDTKVRYEYIQEQFNPEGLATFVAKRADNLPNFSAGLHLNNLYIKNERGDFISQNINLNIKPGSHLNIFSDSEVLLRKLAMTIVKLEPLAAGDIKIGDMSINALASELLSKKVAYIGPEPFMIEGTILQNVNYGLRQQPPKRSLSLLNAAQLETITESAASGNSTDSIDDIWTDFSLAGVKGWTELSLWLQDILSAIGARRMVFEFGLKDYIDPLAIAPTIHDKFSLTKEDLFTNLRGVEADELIERFDIQQYSEHLSVIENIAFGLLESQDEQQTLQTLSDHPLFVKALQKAGIYKSLRDVGEKLAYHIINQMEELGPNDQLNNSYRFYDVDCVRKQLSTCMGRPDHLPSCEFLLSMALSLRISIHGKTWIDESLKSGILALRRQLISSPISAFSDYFEPLRKGRMNQRLTVMENLLWGFERAPNNQRQHQKLVDIVEQALIENQAEALVLIVISLSKVGIRGERLPQIAKQNIQLMRALIKRPEVLLMHNALPGRNIDEINELLVGIKHILPNTSVIVFSSQTRVTAEHVDYYQLDLNGIRPLNTEVPLITLESF